MDESLATNPPPSTPTAILLAAARVFAEAGYRASTVQMIAKEAGFTPPTVYAHFGSKRALFESLVFVGPGRVLLFGRIAARRLLVVVFFSVFALANFEGTIFTSSPFSW